MADATKSGSRKRLAAKQPAQKPALPKWSKVFLAELASTSNVSASARRAKVALTTAYETRRRNSEFYEAWQHALCEGYDHLEMELLCRLRTGEIKPAPGAKKGVRTFENAVALRQLAAHKDSVGRQRAIEGNRNAAEVVAALNLKLDQMRQRALDAGDDVWAVEGDDEQA